jgi:methylenetetrahydrofolate dehydrogenase (NADP+)/methenyltetrahydrofolate cyclohydrolase
VARAIWAQVERRAAVFADRTGAPPHLAVVRVGDDPASAAYLRQIGRTFESHGLRVSVDTLVEGVAQEGLADALGRLGADDSVHGLLLHQPLPSPLRVELAIACVPVGKDVEGVRPENAGLLAQGRPSIVPSTPLAGLEMLRADGVAIAGRTAVVVGRSPIVGRPMAQLLINGHATVITCHTRTPDLGFFTRLADILVLAAGRAALIDGSMVKPGATVIDFGINDVDGRLVGDADDHSTREVAGAVTPVPGGTGPVTTAVLARNLMELAERTTER